MKKKTQAVKPLFLYAPIERVNEEKREVTAYAFVNETVDGEGGIRLKRTAMEAATPDYMAWANVRQMHRADAVGVAEAVVWDAKGALMTLRVVDDAAWEKVKQGVYKGLSVGVRPTIMRGKDVEKAVWFETSLVDRPKDPDSRFVALRADGVEDGQEFECEVDDETRLEDESAAAITRLQGELATKDQTISRLQTEVSAKTQELSAALSRAETAEGRVAELEKQPAPKSPVAKTGLLALDKEDLKRFHDDEEKSKSDLKSELQRLTTAPLDADDPQGEKRAVAISMLKNQISNN